ncbi:MAG: hypothetical protein IJ158_04610 [Treponema sp.]|nr:hypothetical protein [Treponema sp.]
MAKNELTGIERKLVIDYLIQKNPAITVHPAETADFKKTALSFPLVFQTDELAILEPGIILLKERDAYSALEGEQIRIQFYYNKLALYFVGTIQKSSAGLAIVIPEVIYKFEEKSQNAPKEFSVTVFFKSSLKNEQATEITCMFDERFPLFVQDDSQSRIERFLGEKHAEHAESIEGRFHAPSVIFIDCQTIVFAAKKSDMCVSLGSEYNLAFRFPIAGPIKERKICLSCTVEHMFESYDCDRLCALARFSSIREEDRRFLEDKMKSPRL